MVKIAAFHSTLTSLDPPLLPRPEIVSSISALTKLVRVKQFLIDQLQKLNDEAESAVRVGGGIRGGLLGKYGK